MVTHVYIRSKGVSGIQPTRGERRKAKKRQLRDSNSGCLTTPAIDQPQHLDPCLKIMFLNCGFLNPCNIPSQAVADSILINIVVTELGTAVWPMSTLL